MIVVNQARQLGRATQDAQPVAWSDHFFRIHLDICGTERASLPACQLNLLREDLVMESRGKNEHDVGNKEMTADRDIERKLREEFTKHSELKVSDLRVEVKGARATLEGTVADEKSIQRVTALAEKIPQLKGVANKIKVGHKTEESARGPAASVAGQPKGSMRSNPEKPAAR